MKQNFLKKNSYKTLLSNGVETQEDIKFRIISYFFKPYSKANKGTFFYKKLALQTKYIKDNALVDNIKLPLIKEKFTDISSFQKYLIDSKKNSEILGLLVYKNKIFMGQSVIKNFELSESKLFLKNFFLLKTFSSVFQFKKLLEKN